MEPLDGQSEQVETQRSSFRDRHDEGMTAGIHTDVLARDLITMIFPVLGVCSYIRSYSMCLRTRCELEKLEFPSV